VALACAGVYDAIKKGYLKSLFFGVASDSEGTDLMEVSTVTHRQQRTVSSCHQATTSQAHGQAQFTAQQTDH
jgi:hypothetical protein